MPVAGPLLYQADIEALRRRWARADAPDNLDFEGA
jgi:hypothetical protein